MRWNSAGTVHNMHRTYMHTFFRPIQIRAEVQYAMMILVRKSHTAFYLWCRFFLLLSLSHSLSLARSLEVFLLLSLSLSGFSLCCWCYCWLFLYARCHIMHHSHLYVIVSIIFFYSRPVGEIKMHRPDRMDLCEQAGEFSIFPNTWKIKTRLIRA